MKELNTAEMEQVSGAGFFCDLGETLGEVIGGIVDAGTSLGGLKTNATDPAKTLGKGVGSLLELDIIGAISGIGSGVVGIVGFGIDAIKQLNSLK